MKLIWATISDVERLFVKEAQCTSIEPDKICYFCNVQCCIWQDPITSICSIQGYLYIYIYDTWTGNGPSDTIYNKISSGWTNGSCLLECYAKIIILYCRIYGKKVVIEDNLSSHTSPEVIKIKWTTFYKVNFLPPNSTHLSQLLDVSFLLAIERNTKNGC